MDKGRMEAFSDGVIAVAITLLVLNIAVPTADELHARHETLAHALGTMWPQYAAYGVSFMTIGIIWINHHAMISRLRQADRAILILNLVLLMTIAVLPFATDLMATYLHSGTSGEQHLAAAIYAGAFLIMGLSFAALNRLILFQRTHLMHERHQDRQVRVSAFTRSAGGVIPYVVATAVAGVSAYATLIICGLLAVFYASPVASRDAPAES